MSLLTTALSLVKSVPSVVSGVSGIRTYAVIAVVLLAISSSAVGYHYYVVTKDQAAILAMTKSRDDLQLKLKAEQDKNATLQENYSVEEARLQSLKDRYDIDMQSCVDLKAKQKGEIDRLNFDKKKLQEFINANPNSGLNQVIPDAVIDLINGGTK